MLKLSSVCYSETKKSAELVRNVTMEVREADYIVISGQNDAERRALLDILGAVRAPRMGEVYIDGIELSKHTPNQLTILRRSAYGYFLADSELDSALTVGENVALPLIFAGLNASELNSKLERALNIVGLLGFKDLKVKNLNEWQKNKALLARAIVNEPKVLILSEPCRVQDEKRLAEVLGLLSALNRDGVSVIVESNNEEYFAKAKRRIEIAGGTIVEMKKERAPRETQKKSKAKKTSKPKVVKEKSAEIVNEADEIKAKEEAVEVQPIKEEKPKTRKVSANESSTKSKDSLTEVKAPKKTKTSIKTTEAKAEEPLKKTAGRPKKVVEEKTEKLEKRVGRPKKQVEEETKTVKTTTRKKKGGN